MRSSTILAIVLPLLSGAANAQTAEQEIAKQARTCEDMLVAGHPALEDIDVLGRCSAAVSLQEDVLQGKALPDPLPDINVQSALEKWRAKSAAYHDRKPDRSEVRRPEPRPAPAYHDPVSRPICDGVMTDNGCQPRRK